MHGSKLLLILFLCAAGPAVAGPFEDAMAAYHKRDYSTALRLLRLLAEQGNADAQVTLGDMYYFGIVGNVEIYDQNPPTVPQGLFNRFGLAVEWWRKAAQQGNAKAQNKMGDMYYRGLGVTFDHAAAVAWWRKAAEQGDADAQNSLAISYQYGGGVPKDPATAIAWYRKAADQGHAQAQKSLHSLLTKAAPPLASQTANQGTGSTIQMRKEHGIFVIPALINNAITLDFAVDSGAADVSIPQDVVATLMRTGTLREADFVGERTYILADGSRVRSKTFRIRSLKVGDRLLEGVAASVAGPNGSLLLGQSFLSRLKSWSVDNSRHVLTLD